MNLHGVKMEVALGEDCFRWGLNEAGVQANPTREGGHQPKATITTHSPQVPILSWPPSPLPAFHFPDFTPQASMFVLGPCPAWVVSGSPIPSTFLRGTSLFGPQSELGEGWWTETPHRQTQRQRMPPGRPLLPSLRADGHSEKKKRDLLEPASQ